MATARPINSGQRHARTATIRLLASRQAYSLPVTVIVVLAALRDGDRRRLRHTRQPYAPAHHHADPPGVVRGSKRMAGGRAGALTRPARWSSTYLCQRGLFSRSRIPFFTAGTLQHAVVPRGVVLQILQWELGAHSPALEHHRVRIAGGVLRHHHPSSGQQGAGLISDKIFPGFFRCVLFHRRSAARIVDEFVGTRKMRVKGWMQRVGVATSLVESANAPRSSSPLGLQLRASRKRLGKDRP